MILGAILLIVWIIIMTVFDKAEKDNYGKEDCTEKLFVRYIKKIVETEKYIEEYDCFSFNYQGDDYLILVNDSNIYLKEDIIYEMFLNPNDITEYYINNPPKIN